MALPESWHIRSRSRACAATERPFVDGEPIVTALFPDPESSGYLRKDFCIDAWNERPEDAEKPFSQWKAKFHSHVTEEKEDSFKKESPEDLLRRLVEEDEDHTENVRYILAVMLERKKILRETDTQRTPSGILRVYEHRKLGDLFIVRDPDLPLGEIDAVQEEVFTLLEHGGRRPEPELEESADEPSEDTDEPSEDTDEPSEDTDEPSEDTDEPSEDTDKPSEDTDEPSEDTDAPSEDTDEPSGDTDEPPVRG